MKYQFYTTSEQAWQAMEKTVREAREYIFLESYILTEDERTRAFFGALKERAAGGVKVKMIVDRIGSFGFTTLPIEEYAKAGIEILFFSRLFNRNHRKVLIIDGKTAFLGGVNVSGKYAKWLDLHVSVSDKFFLSQIIRSFAKVYNLAGGQDLKVFKYLRHWKEDKPRRALYKTKIFFMDHWPFRRRSALRDYYKRKIAKAERSVVMVTPYFAPHRWLIDSLREAVQRGVSVEIILPRRTDLPLLDAANWIFAEELSDKIKFSFLPEMNHAKILLIDEKEGMVGSNNIDAQSFDLNLETGVIFREKNMVSDLREILNRWRESAVSYEKLPLWRPWYYQPLKFFIKLIRPLL